LPVGIRHRREHILFVCTANVDRSRTAEDLYRYDSRFRVRSAGTAPFATTPISRELYEWADRVFVMNERDDLHQTQIRLRFPGIKRPVFDLDIPDRWFRGDPELVKRILAKLRPHLGEPQAAGDSGEWELEFGLDKPSEG
jgi:predicted protein tyrosine phosphatase